MDKARIPSVQQDFVVHLELIIQVNALQGPFLPRVQQHVANALLELIHLLSVRHR